MALFKIYKGDESVLAEKSLHEGYAYFCSDTGNFFIDATTSNGLERIQINALKADSATEAKTATNATKLFDGVTTVEIDDIFLNSMTASVAQGGTGCTELTANALIVGNGTDKVKLISAAFGALYCTGKDVEPQFGTLPVGQGGTGRNYLYNGAVLAGNQNSGVREIRSYSGALYSTGSGVVPRFGTLPVAQGGTGAITAENARSNLNVYSKDEVWTKLEMAPFFPTYLEITLLTNYWVTDGEGYSLTYTDNFKSFYAPPIITCIDNEEEYNNIISATVDSGGAVVTFYTETLPTSDIVIGIYNLV